MTTRPTTMNAQPRLVTMSGTRSAANSADRIFKTGLIMCIIWLGAATMLVRQAQNIELVGNRSAFKQIFLVPGS